MLRNLSNWMMAIVTLVVVMMSSAVFAVESTESSIAVAESVIVVGTVADPTDVTPLGSFSLDWSEYPSWSTFGVAGVTKVVKVGNKWVIDKGKGELIIDGAKGKLGIVEKKWNVDIVLEEKDYDPCITVYGALQCDAVCLTNMDILAPSFGVKSVAIMPTSTSYGADACIVRKKITDVKQLKNINNYMLALTVSQYCFARNLEILGEKEHLYKVTNMDPGAAALAMQQGQSTHQSITVWNPFVLQTLEKQPGCYVLFDSTSIPGEIIDMVHMSQASLARPGGEEAACAIIEAYYIICELLANPDYQDDTLVALGEKFCDLDAGSMRKVVRQTRFYATPEQGLALYADGVVFPWKRKVANTTTLFTNGGFNPKGKEVTDKTLKDIMLRVVGFCKKYEIVAREPRIGYGSKEQAPNVQLRFDPTYMKKVAESR